MPLSVQSSVKLRSTVTYTEGKVAKCMQKNRIDLARECPSFSSRSDDDVPTGFDVAGAVHFATSQHVMHVKCQQPGR